MTATISYPHGKPEMLDQIHRAAKMDTSVENGKQIIEIKEILTFDEVNFIVKQTTDREFEIIDYPARSASDDGIKGFVGDHFRMTINVKENDSFRKIHLFIKTLPLVNKPKADCIIENKFFKREALMFQLFEEMQQMGGQNSWYRKAFIHNDKLLVMPDLCVQGYQTYPVQRYLDREHTLETVATVAKFHAAVANYFSQKKFEDPGYNFMDIYGNIVNEPPMAFCDSAWIRAAAKLSNNLLREFSFKWHQFAEFSGDLEETLYKLYVQGCNALKEYENTLNVIIHKDLWTNNILFKYKNDEVSTAVLLDFQCIRYAPPAFDIMSFLYLNTSRDFRDRYENEVLQHYFSVFKDNLNELTKNRLQDLGYDEETFEEWCEKARLFGMLLPIGIFPYILMDPKVAQKAFDDPDTYVEYLEVDRSAPVISHARENALYRNRQLEVCEKFVETFVIGNVTKAEIM
ncbi:uncharacterized protein LOC112053892 [Bicyclus anynana]|uniref:Uncharacterized protein LOC112053892 n=1 Tax=Bicyclus anynana TaxID=110368 RepID=A0A6J1NVQ3_BICAN|nr:uncharacterized protein LOC112053892 [Bicyclus anynana]